MESSDVKKHRRPVVIKRRLSDDVTSKLSPDYNVKPLEKNTKFKSYLKNFSSGIIIGIIVGLSIVGFLCLNKVI